MGVDEAAATVSCPQCSQSNPAHQRFCGHCGASLTVACPQCGQNSPIGQRFCGECGTALVATPEPEPIEVAPEPPPPAPAPSPPPPAVAYEPPTDPLVREREVQSLLARAHLQRMRALITDARRTLDLALVVAQTLPPPAAAPVHEMIGDMLAAEERWEQARDAYELALAIEPGRAGAERKFGEMVVKLNDEAAVARLGGPLRGDDLADILREDRPGRRHAGLAMACGLLLPGGGQFYNGQFAKGAAILGVVVVALLFIAVSPDRADLFQNLAGFFALKPVRGAGQIPPLLTGALLVAIGGWLFGLIDAPIVAGRGPGAAASGGNPVPMGSRSDWEV